MIVSATSGAMGGSASEEFINPCPVGEDTFIQCTSCGYAANVEAVKIVVPPAQSYDHLPPASVEDTPKTPTIETLVNMLNERFPRADRPWEAADTLKNVVVNLLHPDGTKEPLAVGLPGNREVDMKRLEAQVSPAQVEAFEVEDFAKNPALKKGYIGPGSLGTKGTSGIRYLLDPRIAEGTAWVTGADEYNKHVIGLVVGRDFTADGTIEAAEVLADDPCPKCGSALKMEKGLEMGHIFQLGRKYAEALGLMVLDQNGKQQVVTMGSYGIGVSRAVAAIAEQTHDQYGLCWPREVAPAQVHIVAAGNAEDVFNEATRIAEGLDAARISVIFDDRAGVSAGVKFKDAELLGMPTIVVVGKGLADGVVEVKDRKSGTKTNVAVTEIIDYLAALTRS